MPPGFKLPDQEIDIWMPAGFGANQLQNRQGKFIKVVARLKPGVGLDQARSEMSTIAGRLQQYYPETNTGWDVKIARLSEVEVGKVRSALMLLLGAVGLVLLIACVNVANLLLARAAARQREFAIRAALGASRIRLIRQLLAESLLLAGLGGLAGALLASWGIRLIASLDLNNVPRLKEIAIDSSVFGFILAVSLLSVLVFGLAPALLTSRTGPQKVLKQQGRGSIGGSGRGLRSALVISEIAIALVLLIGAGLLIKSFLKLQAVEPGFNPDNLLTLRIWLSSSRYGDNPQQVRFFRQLTGQIERVPGVEAVGAIQDLPVRRNRMGYDFVMEGRPLPASGEKPDAAYRVVTPGYFAAMGIPILAGQGFTDRDDNNAPPVVIINQSMARQFWAGEDPIGRRIRFGGDNSRWYSIVGVVGDVKHMGLEEEEGPAIYQPHAQKPPFLRWMTVVVRMSVDPANLVGAIRSQVKAVDKDQPVYDIASMEEIISQSVANPRFYMVMLGLFAFTALILASVGIYGMLVYWVSQRRQEIGIRMALGAQQSDVLKLVLSQGVKISAIGVSLGVIAALVLSRTMSSLLYDVSPADPFTYLGVSLLFISVATLACYLPARRAVKVDPLEALRYE
jgi:putative ABC transport system permease protein